MAIKLQALTGPVLAWPEGLRLLALLALVILSAALLIARPDLVPIWAVCRS